MNVTDLNYALEDKLVKRLDAFSEMVTRKKGVQDVLFTVHGKTGSGKTNSAIVMAYYLKWNIKEKHNQKRDIFLFFSTEMAMEFAKNNKNAIIIIDEPSLDSSSKDQMTAISKNFARLLNTMRQKRHIIIVNITRFWRFPFDLVVDRSLAMVNMKSDNEDGAGRFLYIRQKNLEELWDTKQRTHKARFGKLKSFGGRMPERMEKLDENGKPYFNRMGITINGKPNCTYDDYKELRDQEDQKIGSQDTKGSGVYNEKVWEIRKQLVEAFNNIHLHYKIPKAKLCIMFKITRSLFNQWEHNLEIEKFKKTGKLIEKKENPIETPTTN